MKILIQRILLVLILTTPIVLTAQDDVFSKNPIPIDKLGIHNRNFKIDGFYYERRMRITSENDTINTIIPMIFFENGTAFPFDSFGNSSSRLRFKKGKKKCKLNPKQNFDTVFEFIKCYCEIVELRDKYPIYSIDGNLLRAQFFDDGLAFERQGVILNDSTFVINKTINYKLKWVNYDKHIYKFHQSTKPDSTNIKPYDDIKHYFKE